MRRASIVAVVASLGGLVPVREFENASKSGSKRFCAKNRTVARESVLIQDRWMEPWPSRHKHCTESLTLSNHLPNTNPCRPPMEPVEPWDGAEGLARSTHDAVAVGSGSGSGSEVEEEEGVSPPVAAAANGATTTSSTAVVAVSDWPPRSLLRELIAGPGRRAAARDTMPAGRQVEGREEEQQIRQDVRLFMARLRNILPFLVLFVLKYVYTHATEIAFFACYTLLVRTSRRRGTPPPASLLTCSPPYTHTTAAQDEPRAAGADHAATRY